jgi:hypothetical protein
MKADDDFCGGREVALGKLKLETGNWKLEIRNQRSERREAPPSKTDDGTSAEFTR